MSLFRYVLPISAAVVFAAGSASAQFATSSSSSSTPAIAATASESSSAAPTLFALNESAALPAAPEPAAAASAAGAAQSGGYGGSHGYHEHSLWSSLVFEAGGGFNGPIGSANNFITWGGNLNLGAGYRFNPKFSALLEYQFIDDKLPGKLIAETGATGGNAHIWSFTLAPVYEFFPKSSNDLYATGGYGFYRKVTNFTNPAPAQYCSYFYCGVTYVNQVAGHFSSNQGGWNIGGGYEHRLGGMYGESRVKLFTEVRYLDVLTPSISTQPNGLNTVTVNSGTHLLPVTFGVRW